MTDQDATITFIPAPAGLTVINVGEVYPIAALRVKQTVDSVEVTPMILYPGDVRHVSGLDAEIDGQAVPWGSLTPCIPENVRPCVRRSVRRLVRGSVRRSVRFLGPSILGTSTPLYALLGTPVSTYPSPTRTLRPEPSRNPVRKSL